MRASRGGPTKYGPAECWETVWAREARGQQGEGARVDMVSPRRDQLTERAWHRMDGFIGRGARVLALPVVRTRCRWARGSVTHAEVGVHMIMDAAAGTGVKRGEVEPECVDDPEGDERNPAAGWGEFRQGGQEENS